MKFTVALFAVGALAAVRRQATGLAGNIDAITSAAKKVTTAIEAYTGDVQQALAVNSATGDVLSAIQAAQSTADGLTAIDQDTALSLANPIQALSTAVKASITALIAKEPTFSGAGLKGAVLESLESQKSASAALTTSIVSKLPTALQDTGRKLAQPAADAIADGITAYSGGDSPSPSTATSSAAGPPAAAAPAGSSSTTAASSSAVTPAVAATPASSSSTTSAPTAPGIAGHSGASTSCPGTTSSAAITSSAPARSSAPAPTYPTGFNATSTYRPVLYTGAASHHVVGFGALAVGALVAAL